MRGKGIVKKVLGKYGAHLAKLNLATSGGVIVIGAAFMIGQGLYIHNLKEKNRFKRNLVS